MKKIGFVVMAAAALCGCVEKDSRSSGGGAMFRLHWIGSDKASEGTNTLAKVLKVETTAELRNEALAKLAQTPQALWKKELADATADQSATLRPLLDDLWKSECILELRGSAKEPDVVVAVQIDDSRADLWSKNLRQAATGWECQAEKPITGGQARGWSLTGNGLGVHYARLGKWVLAAIAHGSAVPFEEWLKTNPSLRALEGSIAEVRADWPRLHRAFPELVKYEAPGMELKVSARGPSLRTEGKFAHSERLPIKLESWKVPTNLVVEPLISFTCVQGIESLLDKVKGFSQLELKERPNQISMWSLGNMHAQTYVAVPIANATNVMRQVAPRLPEFVKANLTNAPGQFLWISNRSEWVWSGLPVVIPHVRPEKTPGGDYIFAGLFPMGPKSNMAPAELFAQLKGRTNLVYYDWELTHERLPHARQMMQLSDIINRRRLAPTNSIAYRWTRAVESMLGNSVTEMTLSSPKELSFVRKSELGFTGFELVMLTRWIESPGFPLQYEPPPPIGVRTNRPAGAKKPPAP